MENFLETKFVDMPMFNDFLDTLDDESSEITYDALLRYLDEKKKEGPKVENLTSKG